MSSMLRSLARNRAKENMKALGLTHFCKQPHSTFADDWRDFASGVKFANINPRRKNN